MPLQGGDDTLFFSEGGVLCCCRKVFSLRSTMEIEDVCKIIEGICFVIYDV